MPQLGDLVKASTIGYAGGNARYVKCPICGLERWICHRRQRKNPPPIEPIKLCPKCRMNRWLEKRDYHRDGHPLWKGGRNKTRFGYIRIFAPDHPRANLPHSPYVFEHILVWEKAHNQSLPKGWVIHHINGIKDDNRLKNLLAMSRNGHSPSLNVKAIQKRLREVEAELAQQRMAI